MDEFDLTLNLIIADYTGDENRDTLTKSQAETQFERVTYFLDEVYKGSLRRSAEPSTPVFDLIELLWSNQKRIRKYRYILLTDSFMSSRITELETKTYNDIPIEYQIWDIERIYNVCFSDLGRQDIEIDFKALADGKGIPCLETVSANSDDYKSFLCIVPGELLADLYDSYGSQLLEGNVRSFLSTKVEKKKKIRETILRIPQHFKVYISY